MNLKTLAPREAVLSDIEEVLRLGAFMYATVGAVVDDAWHELGRAQIEARLGRDLFGWVIDSHKASHRLAACGFVNLTPRLPLPNATSGTRGYIQWVVTDHGHQRQGLASAIMREIIAWTDAHGIDVVELHSSPVGRRLYELLGFSYWPDVEYPASVRGAPMRRHKG